MAHRIAMLDHLAGGCFYWGVGARGLSTDWELAGPLEPWANLRCPWLSLGLQPPLDAKWQALGAILTPKVDATQ